MMDAASLEVSNLSLELLKNLGEHKQGISNVEVQLVIIMYNQFEAGEQTK